MIIFDLVRSRLNRTFNEFQRMSAEISSSEVESTGQEQGEYVTLKNHDDYEILNVYPFTIRKKCDKQIVSESITNTGYPRVNLNKKSYMKHRLIALQFLDNPENLSCVDHISKDRTDYHLSNMRWCNQSTNCKNRTSMKNVIYEFITDIPDDAIKIDYYDTKTERREFVDGDYYYANVDGEDRFYQRITDDGLYKIMHINENKSGNQSVSLKDKDHKTVNVFISKFKHLYDIHE